MKWYHIIYDKTIYHILKLLTKFNNIEKNSAEESKDNSVIAQRINIK